MGLKLIFIDKGFKYLFNDNKIEILFFSSRKYFLNKIGFLIKFVKKKNHLFCKY